MDGRAVNWSVQTKLANIMQTNHTLFNISTSGLHTVHNSFEHGPKASAWEQER